MRQAIQMKGNSNVHCVAKKFKTTSSLTDHSRNCKVGKNKDDVKTVQCEHCQKIICIRSFTPRTLTKCISRTICLQTM